jgi:hypothetical protein
VPRFLLGIVVAWLVPGVQAGLFAADDKAPNPRAFATSGRGDEPRPADPTFVVVPAPADLDALLQRLARPDFVVLDWARYARLLASSGSSQLPVKTGAPIVGSVELRGDVGDADASLRLSLGVCHDSEEPSLLPIGLDEVFLQSAHSGSTNLAVERLEDGGWGLVLPGRGRHQIEVAFRARVVGRGNERRLTVRIPESASTSLDIALPSSAREAKVGGRLLPLEHTTGETPAARCRASIGPRTRLDLSWSASAAGEQAAFSVASQAAVSLEPGLLRWQSTHELQVQRGRLSNLSLTLDPLFTDYRVMVDGIPAELEAGKDGQSSLRLASPAAAGDARTVEIRASLSLADSAALKGTLHGVAFPQATDQTGWLTARSEPNAHLECQPRRSISPLGPGRGAPEGLLGSQPRPSCVFRATDSPFELDFAIEPMRPWVWVDTRNHMLLARTALISDLWLDYQTQSPRPHTVTLALPPGWALDSVGPDSLIESTAVLTAPTESAPGPRLIVRLKEAALPSTKFSLHFVCRWTGPRMGELVLPWVRPLDALSWSGTTTVSATADLEVRPVLDDTLVLLSEPAEERKSVVSPALSADSVPRFTLQHARTPSDLRLEVRSEPLEVRAQSDLEVFVDRSWATLLDQVTLSIDRGILHAIDLNVPPDLGENWEVEGVEISHRETLAAPGSPTITRLHLVKPYRDRVRFRIRSRWPVQPGADKDWSQLVLQPVGIAGATLDQRQVQLGSSGGLDVKPEGTGWTANAPGEPEPLSDRHMQFSQNSVEPDPGPIRLWIRSASLARLPAVLIPRMWVVGTRLSDGNLSIDLRCVVERHQGQLEVNLPAGSTWNLALVGGVPAEFDAGDDRTGVYSLGLPRVDEAKGVTVHLSYVVPASAHGTGRWLPSFPAGVQILDVFWELRVGPSLCVLGVPEGWDDSNHWFLGSYAFRRRPNWDPAELQSWVDQGTTDGVSPGSEARSLVPGPAMNRLLFHQAGTPASAEPWVINRVVLIAVSSAALLGAALVGMLVGMGLPMFLVLLVACALLAATFGPTVLVAQMLQSGVSGIFLAGVAWFVGRKTLTRRRESRAAASSLGPDSGRPREIRQEPEGPAHEVASAASDSTLIRPRPDAARGSAASPAAGSSTAERPVGSSR